MEVSEFFHHNNPHQLSTLDNNNNMVTTSEPFVVEELLNLPSDDDPFHMDNVGSSLHSFPGDSITNSSSSLTNTVLSSSASNFNVTDESATTVSRTLPEAHLSSDLCVPVPDDDLAQLELVSSVAEETFSNEDLQNLQIISGVKVEPTEIQEFQGETNQSNNNNSPIFESDVSVPAKARSKRPRVTSCNWATRALHVSSSNSPCPSLISSASTPPDTDAVVHSPAAKKRLPARRKDPVADNRRCFHCSTNHTPQWRTGPMGPKTLCNACGVRYKSGRLVPEYRPAASPTFVLTEHSNSHRKVMELRRQKDMMQHQHQHRQFLQHPHMMFEFQHVTNADDYLIHQHLGHDFMQLIG